MENYRRRTDSAATDIHSLVDFDAVSAGMPSSYVSQFGARSLAQQEVRLGGAVTVPPSRASRRMGAITNG